MQAEGAAFPERGCGAFALPEGFTDISKNSLPLFAIIWYNGYNHNYDHGSAGNRGKEAACYGRTKSF